MCIKSLSEEFALMKNQDVKLIIVASHFFCDRLIGKNISFLIFEHQLKKLSQEKSLLKLPEVLKLAEQNMSGERSKKRHKLGFKHIKHCIGVLKTFENCQIVFFPNPSNANISMLRKFFQECNQSKVHPALERLHNVIEEIFHE